MQVIMLRPRRRAGTGGGRLVRRSLARPLPKGAVAAVISSLTTRRACVRQAWSTVGGTAAAVHQAESHLLLYCGLGECCGC